MGRIAGVILAGGASARMGGGDKCLRPLAGRPILGHVIERMRPQVDALALNANGDPARFAAFGLPVLPDPLPGLGPLGGVLAGLYWARDLDCIHLMTAAGDTPFFPRDTVTRLCERAGSGAIVQSSSERRTHPTFALWPVRLLDDLDSFLRERGAASMHAYAGERHRTALVDFAAETGLDPFFNINTMEDLAFAERIAEEMRK